MATVTVTENSQVKNKQKDLKEATRPKDLDKVLENVKKIDNTCCFKTCKMRTKDIAMNCPYCNLRFCITHGLPEIHGCGEAVRREAVREFLHPPPKSSEHKRDVAADKLTMKLKQMQLARKSKQGFRSEIRKK